jgi:hypothetical protein
MQILERLPTYIGRDAEKALLRETALTLLSRPETCAIYLQAAGGLGKTWMLQLLPQILRGERPVSSPALGRLRVAQVVDLYNFESHNPEVIEQQLVDGLKQAQGEWYRVPAAEINRIFHPYLQAAKEYRRIREIGSAEEREQGADTMRQLFISCWNHLAATYPLVICFDTVETLFARVAPKEALISVGEPTTGANLVLNWIRRVLPELHHTMAVFSGRPIPGENPLITLLQGLRLLRGGVQTLERFTHPEEIRAYLSAYNLSVDDEQIPYLQTITEGRPLLLTCYAETLRPQEGIPPPLPQPDNVADRPAFEDWLVDTVLNPVRQVRGTLQQSTLGYCLYFLVYARRGVQPEQLETLFERLELPFDRSVVARLYQLALIKTVGGLLFLHDEIFAMIDESRKPDEFGLRLPTLDYLCDISRNRVRIATQEADRGVDLLGAMFDNMYYELIRDVRNGYRAYTIYSDRLLRERRINGVLVLSDVFWGTYNRFQDALAELDDLTYDKVIHDEQVRRIKLLRAQDRNEEALELAEQLANTFEHDNVLAEDSYLFVDFGLTRASALIQAHTPGYEAEAERLVQNATSLLEQPDALTDKLLLLRRYFFLGNAHVYLGYLRNQQQAYRQSIQEAESARTAYKRYRDERLAGLDQSAHDLLNDFIDTDLAQVMNNLAYDLARSGGLRRALRLSNELIDEFGASASDYRRALFYNTNALIHMWSNRYLEAIAPLNQAVQAATLSGSSRARGLVAHGRGLLEREMMKARGEPLPEIEQYFAEAAEELKQEPNSLREVHFDWARFARDIAQLYRHAGKAQDAARCERESLAHVDLALGLLPPGPSMQRADLLECKAVIYLHMGDLAQADSLINEAEAMMNQTMTDYGQIVSGKLALQRAMILIQRGEPSLEALRPMAIALTRAYIFGKQHRDQGTFERLIEQQLNRMPEEILQEFREATESGRLRVIADDLPYQRPDPARWDHEWGFSIRFMNEIIETLLDI